MLRNKQILLALGDGLSLVLAFTAMTLLRFDLYANKELIAVQSEIFAGLFILWIVVFFIFDLYNIRRSNPNPRTVGLLSLAIGTATLLSALLFYLFPNSFGVAPKSNLVLVGVFSLIIVIGWRRLAYRLFAKTMAYTITTIGTSAALQELINEIQHHPEIGTVIEQQPTLTDQTVVAPQTTLVITEESNPSLLLTIAQKNGREIVSPQQAYEVLFAKIPVTVLTDQQAVQLLGRPQFIGYAVVVRVVEVILATLLLILTSPVLLCAAIAIYLEDRGSIIYKQSRVGKNGIPFMIYKLRSMRSDAEKHGAQWATSNDTRITRVGAFLRKTHIDEILQMVNIIRGELALIGPRPERPEFVTELEKTIPYYNLRHIIRPGFTGWAQIKFRYARTADESREKFAYDLYYIKNRQPLLDIGIVLKTVQIIFTH